MNRWKITTGIYDAYLNYPNLSVGPFVKYLSSTINNKDLIFCLVTFSSSILFNISLADIEI